MKHTKNSWMKLLTNKKEKRFEEVKHGLSDFCTSEFVELQYNTDER